MTMSNQERDFEATEKETGRRVTCRSTLRGGFIRIKVTFPDGAKKSYPESAFANLFAGVAS